MARQPRNRPPASALETSVTEMTRAMHVSSVLAAALATRGGATEAPTRSPTMTFAPTLSLSPSFAPTGVLLVPGLGGALPARVFSSPRPRPGPFRHTRPWAYRWASASALLASTGGSVARNDHCHKMQPSLISAPRPCASTQRSCPDPPHASPMSKIRSRAYSRSLLVCLCTL